MYDPYFVSITPAMRGDLILREQTFGPAFKGHEIEGGKGRIWGTLGELVVGSILGPLGATETLTSNYDLVWRGRTYDIKTKTRKDIPKGEWDASISAASMHQKTDYYILVSIIAQASLINLDPAIVLNYPYTDAYILGYVSKDDFLLNAELQKAGQVDPKNGIVYRSDVFNLPYAELTPFRTLLGEKPKILPKALAKFR